MCGLRDLRSGSMRTPEVTGALVARTEFLSRSRCICFRFSASLLKPAPEQRADGQCWLDPNEQCGDAGASTPCANLLGTEKWRLGTQSDNARWAVSWAHATRLADSIEAGRVILLEAVERLPDAAILDYNLACYECSLGRLKRQRPVCDTLSSSMRASGSRRWMTKT